ncbi:transposable element Tc1 transposase [Elysia marginata]|uniref:Transposable element Tc1 transposase n=1 Tax=Elysia marginata TaxID=1093978 RepID=A0AAV4F9Z9_9GAST|nr:transposable element Tc1 transposase [Elysia marginata]
MNVNRTTIFRLRQRLHETDTVSDQSRSGRPRRTTQRQDRNLVQNHMNNRFLSASASSHQTKGRNNQRISANTVRRNLSTSGLRARRPYIGPILSSFTDTNVRSGPRNMPLGSHPMAKCRIQ